MGRLKQNSNFFLKWNGVSQWNKAVLVLVTATLLVSSAFADDSARDRVFVDSRAHWRLASAISASKLTGEGERKSVPSEGQSSRAGVDVVRFDNAYLNAGKELNLRGEAFTIFARVRDPQGAWLHAFVAKRGRVETTNINFFASQYPNRNCPEVAIEFWSTAGFGRCSFPVSHIDRTAWHDLVARYDGKTVELFCDGKQMSRTRHRGKLFENQEPLLIGAWTDGNVITHRHKGEMEEIALWETALNDDALATLMRSETITKLPTRANYDSPIHYRPKDLILADTIPFFWKGEYHIFYLRAGEGGTPWAHVVSRDLTNWKELPDALPLGAPDEPDGENVFTGSVLEHQGVFHIFYTGWNPRTPIRERIMHATSDDLIHWKKIPEHAFAADGVHYQNQRGEDFRDPFVFWNEKEQCFWMLLCARSAADGRPVTGLATSTDLIHWKQEEPLCSDYKLTPECPDLFEINGTWYLIVSPSENFTVYRTAPSPRGPWTKPPFEQIDSSIFYAAKRMYDEKRHVITGWIRDLDGERDDGAYRWGGSQSLAREIYADSKGQLASRPAQEVIDRFSKQTTQAGPLEIASGSVYETHAPKHLLLDTRIRVPTNGATTIHFRRQQKEGRSYRLQVNANGAIALTGPAFRHETTVSPPRGEPLRVLAFLQDSILECFIGEEKALSARVYDLSDGSLAIQSTGGETRIDSLEIRSAE